MSLKTLIFSNIWYVFIAIFPIYGYSQDPPSGISSIFIVKMESNEHVGDSFEWFCDGKFVPKTLGDYAEEGLIFMVRQDDPFYMIDKLDLAINTYGVSNFMKCDGRLFKDRSIEKVEWFELRPERDAESYSEKLRINRTYLSNGEAEFRDLSRKRGIFEIEVIASCKQIGKYWWFDEVQLRLEKHPSVNITENEASIGLVFKIIEANISKKTTVAQINANYGLMIDYSEYFNGKECR